MSLVQCQRDANGDADDDDDENPINIHLYFCMRTKVQEDIYKVKQKEY